MKSLTIKRLTLPVAILASFCGAAAGAGCVPTGIYAEVEAAPPPAHAVLVETRPGWIWVEGRWLWNGYRWIWEDGYWVASRPGYVYLQGEWAYHGRRWTWTSGRWVRQRPGYVHLQGHWTVRDRRRVWVPGRWERSHTSERRPARKDPDGR